MVRAREQSIPYSVHFPRAAPDVCIGRPTRELARDNSLGWLLASVVEVKKCSNKADALVYSIT